MAQYLMLMLDTWLLPIFRYQDEHKILTTNSPNRIFPPISHHIQFNSIQLLAFQPIRIQFYPVNYSYFLANEKEELEILQKIVIWFLGLLDFILSIFYLA